MLEMWLARNTDVTWKNVLEAIDSPAVPHGIPSTPAPLRNDPVNASEGMKYVITLGMCQF